MEEKDNVLSTEELKDTSEAEHGAEAQEETGSAATDSLGKFKSVDALLRAYNSLQAEFTRRSQRLKEFMKAQARNNLSETEREPVPMSEKKDSVPMPMPECKNAPEEENLYERANACAEVKQRIIENYLDEVKKSAVPLMGGGISVVSPAAKAKNFTEAGELALGYFRNNR